MFAQASKKSMLKFKTSSLTLNVWTYLDAKLRNMTSPYTAPAQEIIINLIFSEHSLDGYP